MDLLFNISLLIAIGNIGFIIYMYHLTYRDPRWRGFDFHSRQAAEGEIYTVAERPVIRRTKLVAPRLLRFEFMPEIKTDSWQIISLTNGKINRSPYPELSFPDAPHTESYRFIPERVDLVAPIEITVSFYPRENYAEAGLSWPDNYYSPQSSHRFSFNKPHSIRDWAGLPSHDLDVIHARSILEDRIDVTGPASTRMQSVFTMVMKDLEGSGGIPTDELLDASPMKTYEMMHSGNATGFCENNALVYYLFANAAGIPTRLVDMSGKIGPLKLTGHYVCESWVQDHGCWAYVDPQSQVAGVINSDRRYLNTLDIKKLVDMGLLDTCRVYRYDSDKEEVREQNASEFASSINGYLRGDLVLAYKFGYPRNLSYARLRNFLRHPVLLYATFRIPRLYYMKILAFVLACLGVLGVLISGLWTTFDVPE